MGFQTGSQIRPELGALDYSGYTNAANIQAQAMANLGQKIGGAIEGYYKKKEEKDQKDLRFKTLLPFVEGVFGSGKDSKNIATMLAGDPEMADTAIQFATQAKQQNIMNSLNKAAAVSTTTDGKIDWDSFSGAAVQFDVPLEVVNSFLDQNAPDVVKDGIIYSRGSGQFKGNLPKASAGKPVSAKDMLFGLADQLGTTVDQLTPEQVATLGSEASFELSKIQEKASKPPEQTPAQKKFSEARATALANVNFERADSDVGVIDDVINKLTSGEVKTGGLKGAAMSVMPSSLASLAGPEAQNTLRQVQSVVFKSLKEVLGGAFTKSESDSLVASAFDMSLRSEQNADRLKTMRDLIKDTVDAAKAERKYLIDGGNYNDYSSPRAEDVWERGKSKLSSSWTKGEEGGSENEKEPLQFEIINIDE